MTDDPRAPRRAALWLLGALALYFALQLASRVWVSDAVELDEAEQVLWAQQLAWGYGTQPPLYTWLQAGVFSLFGTSVFSLALLKNVLLFGTYAFTFLAARRVLPPATAAIASASMLLLPQIGWESQRDLTHSVLCTTAAAASLWLVLELRHRPRLWCWLALGLAAGLGTLAKYSYAGFALVLLAALAWHRPTRPLLASGGLAAAVVVALLVIAPHGLWLWQNLPQATAGTLAKMDGGPAPSWAAAVAGGLGSLALAVLAFLTPWWLVAAVLHGRSLWRRGDAAGGGRPPPHPVTGLFVRYAVLLAVLFAGLVLAGAATHFKDRWMQPFLFFAPLAALVAIAPTGPLPRAAAWRGVIVAIALLWLAGLAARPAINGARDRPDELNLPAAALAAAVRDSGYSGGLIVTDDRTLGAALRLHLPDSRVRVVRGEGAAGSSPGPRTGDAHDDAVALWIAAGPSPRAVLALAGADAAERIQPLALPYRHARPGAPPLRWWIVRPPTLARVPAPVSPPA